MDEALHQRQKRIKPMEEYVEDELGIGGGLEDTAHEMALEVIQGSEEMEQNIQCILDKIQVFTQQVSEMLEAWKAMLSNLSSEFEDCLISVHKEQIEKWQEEIKELQARDASNEAARSLLGNAQNMLHSLHEGSSYTLIQNNT